MKNIEKKNLPEIFVSTLEKNPDSPALGFAGEEVYTYREVSQRIIALQKHLTSLGVEKGSKVAILGTNSPNWAMAFYAVTFMGAVAVPLLPDFSASELEKILPHSEAEFVFVTEKQKNKLEKIELKGLLSLDTFDFLDIDQDNSLLDFPDPDALASIIYTSGTTGNPKGVMLSHWNIAFTALMGARVQPVETTDRFLSLLPLSHTYENTLGLVLPLTGGSAVYYLKQLPTPSVMLNAMKVVQPTIVLSVPLIIEKVYRNKVLPGIKKNALMRMLFSTPFGRKFLHRKAGEKVMESFGGKIKFFGIGGAKLDKVVERFLLDAKFPYAIGYGLTETSPLIAGTNPRTALWQSTGPVIDHVELKIHQPDPETGEGEVWARGPNVMQGYYKNPEQTSEVINEEGWFKTGDLGFLDKNKFLFICGRLKNVILGASGENIYPEEIESELNNFQHVSESLVLQKKGQLVAMVHINREELEKKYRNLKDNVNELVEKKMEELQLEIHKYINERVNKFSQIQAVVIHPVPFVKTPTQKIKRYLYK